MPRLMTYNIEWFTEAFDAQNDLNTDADSQKQLEAVAGVIRSIDPDLIGITEGPNTTTTTGERNTVAALRNFANAHGLRQSEAVMGFPSAGRQEIAVMFDPATYTAEHDPGGRAGSKSNPPFNQEFYVDSDEDGVMEVYKHYRPPLEAKITHQASGEEFTLIVVHAKSKAIFDATDREHFERISERNRRKLFAECTSIRNRALEHLRNDRPVVVMGDINDGPGFDYYEGRFGRSAVELLMGSVFVPQEIMRNPVGPPKWGKYGWEPSTAQFTDRFTGDRVNALIDHILLSRHFDTDPAVEAIVWNPFQTDAAKPLKAQLMDASDHFPVTVDIP